MRLLRGPVLAAIGVLLASAVGCGDSTEPPKSFSKNIERQPEAAPGKTAAKPKMKNQQVRGFTVPQG